MEAKAPDVVADFDLEGLLTRAEPVLRLSLPCRPVQCSQLRLRAFEHIDPSSTASAAKASYFSQFRV